MKEQQDLDNIVTASVNSYISELYQSSASKVLATLIRLLQGQFEVAEEVTQEAFSAALKQWPQQGIPHSPEAWLIRCAHNKAIDLLRQQQGAKKHAAQFHHLQQQDGEVMFDTQTIADDQLRLIFTCCHPALAIDKQIALTLKTVCGLSTAAIANAFLVPVATLAQRIVRAKAKIRQAGIPFAIPEQSQLSERLPAVLRVIYLVFNEGYNTSSGTQLINHQLCFQGIRLAQLLHHLLPHSEVAGLLALLLLQDARRPARVDVQGRLIPLAQQDRACWHRQQIEEATAILRTALQSPHIGEYCIQASIAALHCEARSSDTTDWQQIVGLYTLLYNLTPSNVVALNRAVAIAMSGQPSYALELIDRLIADSELHCYHLAFVAKGDLHALLKQNKAALIAYQRAAQLTEQHPEQAHIAAKIAKLKK